MVEGQLTLEIKAAQYSNDVHSISMTLSITRDQRNGIQEKVHRVHLKPCHFTRDLSVYRLWCVQGILEPMPTDTNG